MVQGDAYSLKVEVIFDDNPINPETIDTVEICVGGLKKVYPGAVTYEDGYFLFPVTQNETFAFSACRQRAQIRVKFKSGDVYGMDLGDVDVSKSISKEVL